MVLRRPPSVNLRDTNVALLGSDLERRIKAAAAAGEPQWCGVGKEHGVQVWRIEQFKVVPWPRAKYGQFHEGDSYVLLHTFVKHAATGALGWAIYFWIGAGSSADEFGTAAYKAQELDHLLGDAAVQHRVVQGSEPPGLLALLPDGAIKVVPGGADSGFRHVAELKQPAVLLRVKGDRGREVVKYVAPGRAALRSGDVFVLGDGRRVWKWVGGASSVAERAVGEGVARALQATYGAGAAMEVVEEDAEGAEFWAALGGRRTCLPGWPHRRKEGRPETGNAAREGFPVLFRLEERRWAPGKLRLARERRAARGVLRKDAVFLLDSGAELFVWVGGAAPEACRRGALSAAQRYVADANRPHFLPLSRLNEGAEPPQFLAALA